MGGLDSGHNRVSGPGKEAQRLETLRAVWRAEEGEPGLRARTGAGAARLDAELGSRTLSRPLRPAPLWRPSTQRTEGPPLPWCQSRAWRGQTGQAGGLLGLRQGCADRSPAGDAAHESGPERVWGVAPHRWQRGVGCLSPLPGRSLARGTLVSAQASPVVCWAGWKADGLGLGGEGPRATRPRPSSPQSPRPHAVTLSVVTMLTHHVTPPCGCGLPEVTQARSTVTPSPLPVSASLHTLSAPLPPPPCPHAPVPLPLCPHAPVFPALRHHAPVLPLRPHAPVFPALRPPVPPALRPPVPPALRPPVPQPLRPHTPVPQPLCPPVSQPLLPRAPILLSLCAKVALFPRTLGLVPVLPALHLGAPVLC
ncbi:uncharacterized protein LOC129539521 [Moschus berezovskii]|uniref:uncharacterized protein LOC129539521 n=1 Tax=Moschus berezovskii TaxID=68408 RepID=UPI0024439CF9|nr:uncharacterized protein LOC129539521 [Moschus berezovskii]XP_055256179.1 uncharacterized protein LOC129539521 [Moschus berezovskii]XP_055256180.1 uncharacterized protein LOC129539521 [Moschus berezovskii]XP_055256181.1 uncharacterized protein LOC129539521 [Moschus berezovskii]